MSKLWLVLPDSSAETIIDSFNTSHLGYCNIFLLGLFIKALDTLQYVQNSAAGVPTYTHQPNTYVLEFSDDDG